MQVTQNLCVSLPALDSPSSLQEIHVVRFRQGPKQPTDTSTLSITFQSADIEIVRQLVNANCHLRRHLRAWSRSRMSMRIFSSFVGAGASSSCRRMQLMALTIKKITMPMIDRKSTRLNSSHVYTSYAVFCLKKKTITTTP